MGPDSHYMGGDLPAFFGALHIWGKELHFYSHTVPANSAALLSWWISRFFELFRASKHKASAVLLLAVFIAFPALPYLLHQLSSPA